MVEVNGKPDQETIAEEAAVQKAKQENEKFEEAKYAGAYHRPLALLKKIKGREGTPAPIRAMIDQHLKWYEAEGLTD